MLTKGIIQPGKVNEGDAFPHISDETLEQVAPVDYIKVRLNRGPEIVACNNSGIEVREGDEVAILVAPVKDGPDAGYLYNITAKLSLTATA